MSPQNATLSQLYSRLHASRDHSRDQCELRANSDTAPLRVKTRTAFFSSVTSRQTHQTHALVQVKASLTHSLRERLRGVSPNVIHLHRDAIWRKTLGARDVIRLGDVRALADSVRQIPREIAPALRPPASGAQPTTWHAARQRAGQGPTAAAAAVGPSRTGIAPARATHPTAPTDEEIVAALQEQFKRPGVTDARPSPQTYFYNLRLKELVRYTRKVLPELLDGSKAHMDVLTGAGQRIRKSVGCRMLSAVALYKELVGRNAALADKLIQSLPPGAKSAVRQNLVLERTKQVKPD